MPELNLPEDECKLMPICGANELIECLDKNSRTAINFAGGNSERHKLA